MIQKSQQEAPVVIELPCGHNPSIFLSDGIHACPICKAKVKLDIPSYCLIVRENDKNIMRFDVGLLLGEVVASSDIAPSYVSLLKHMKSAIDNLLPKLESSIVEKDRQAWW